jgi:ELWxxDGT repeat protein/VCBS repeat-containing protein
MTIGIFYGYKSGSGPQLWATDGTSVGTFQITNLVGGLLPQNFVDLNGTLFFLGSDATGGGFFPGIPVDWQLWATDGTLTGTVKITNGNFLYAGSLTAINGNLFFAASDSNNGLQLWKSDGTAAGTVMLTDINPSNGGLGVGDLIEYNNKLYFFGNDPVQGVQLWESDGTTAGTVPIVSVADGFGDIVVANGVLFFEGGTGIWKTDGTPNGTVKLATTSDNPSGVLTAVNGTVFFAVIPFDGYVHGQLWKSDGTVAGTNMIIDFGYGSQVGFSNSFKAVNDLLFFTAINNQGLQLWRSDGTAAGTVMLTDINPSNGGLGVGDLIEYNNKLYFFGNDPVHGLQLWESDGTTVGTIMVTDINSAAGGIGFSQGPVEGLTTLNGSLFFDVADLTGGTEFWTSDGTSAGTVMYDDVTGLFTQSPIFELPNRNPVANPDVASVQKGATVTTDAAHGLLANDSDLDHDVLHVSAINGISTNVGHAVTGAYGTLTVNADGSYSYTANKALGSAAAHGAVDHFSYTVSDGHGGTASSTLSVTVDLHAPAAVGSLAVLADAKAYIGSAWGNENCTGFVFTVSNDIHAPFFYGAGAPVQEAGAYGNDSAHVHLLNDTHSSNSFLFAEPISDIQAISSTGLPTGGVQLPSGYVALTIKGSALVQIPSSTAFVFERADTTGDNWHLVGGTNRGNFSTINPNDPSTWPAAGDIFRGVVIENSTVNGSHELITHAGVVSSYDPVHDTLTLIDNYAHSLNGQDTIGYTTFNVHAAPGHFPALLAGYYDVYHLV